MLFTFYSQGLNKMFSSLLALLF